VKSAASLCLFGILALGLLIGIGLSVAAVGVAYKAEIVGLKDDDLQETLAAVSHLIAETERPPPTLEALKRRAEDDLPRLQEALASLGYYGAELSYDIDAKASPVRVTIHVTPGEPYHLAGYHIAGDNPDLSNGKIRLTRETLGLQPGMVAAAKPVVEGEQRLLTTLAAQAYPLARVADRRVVVDHATRSMTVEWRIDTGPYARFGTATIDGLQTLDPAFVQARLPWEVGQPFDGSKVDEGRQTLIDSGLFSSVKIAHAQSLDADGRLPMTVTLVEGKRHSVGGGVSYSTSEGFGAKGFGGKAFWEHRNLFGEGERLIFTLEGGETVQGAKADFRKPDLTERRLAWLGGLQALREDRDAYESLTFGGSGGVEYEFTDELTGTGSLSLERSRIDDHVTDQTFTLLGTPLGLAFDTTDDLLNPSRGTRVNLGLTPYFSVADSDVNFAVTRLSDSFYISLDKEHDVVLASRALIGTIVGADSTEELPATKRLYGGGAGSVRAYGFQKLGPVGPTGEPTGGRSQLELGTELRWRMFGDFGGAVFVEGGNVYDDELPDLNEPIRWGAGVGLRYFTDFGPVRLDVAFPINPRRNDDTLEFYIGLGQAF
jgi:translocation and assembly module TamA